MIDNEKVHCKDGDVLYLDKNTIYSAEGNFEAVIVNVPAFGVVKEWYHLKQMMNQLNQKK